MLAILFPIFIKISHDTWCVLSSSCTVFINGFGVTRNLYLYSSLSLFGPVIYLNILWRLISWILKITIYIFVHAVRRSLQQDLDHTHQWCLDKLKLFAITQILQGAAVVWMLLIRTVDEYVHLLSWSLIGTVPPLYFQLNIWNYMLHYSFPLFHDTLDLSRSQ